MKTKGKDIPYFRYFKPPLYLFFTLFGAASIQKSAKIGEKTSQKAILVGLLYENWPKSAKRGFYSNAAYNSGNTVDICSKSKASIPRLNFMTVLII